jgi:hypothetical protein
VLSESQQGLLLHGAPTFVLPSDRPRLPLLAERAAALQQTLHTLDELESGLGRVSLQLGKQALALLRKRWPRGVLPSAPQSLLELAQRVSAAETAEEEHGLQAALLREQVQAEQRRAELRRFELHRRLVAARDVERHVARRERPPEAESETPTLEDPDQLERECLSALPESPQLHALQRQLHAAQTHLQELQAAVHVVRRQLAGQTLHAYLKDVAARGGADAVQESAYHQLESTLASFDEQSAAVTLVCEKLPIREGLATH